MKKLGFSVAALLTLLAARPASATIFDIFAQVQGGGMYGKGVAGQAKDNDFFEEAAGGSYGVLAGAKLFFLTGFVEHDQFFRSGITGTWTHFMLGVSFDFKVGDLEEGQKPKNFGRFSLTGGYGMGTGQQVDPPLDNAQISDKGFVAQLAFAMEHRFNKVMAFGLMVPVEYGYLFKNQEGAANDESLQYQSVHAAAYLYLRFHLELK